VSADPVADPRAAPDPRARPGGLTAQVTTAAFREAVGRFATGVTVVTTTADGVDHAMTANAFTSVSLEPLLVLVCVEKAARFHDAMLRSRAWGICVLDASAREASTWFATRGRPLENQFARFPYFRGERTGVPLLTGSLATLECGTQAVYDGGDHTIVVGRVLSVGTPLPDGRPLVYYQGAYHALDRVT
jgi:flavin reductase (DIM6/NTAB) family NADH-FMN oxidoreductase RutF